MKHDNAMPHNDPVKTSKKYFGMSMSKSTSDLSAIRMNDTYRSTLQLGQVNRKTAAPAGKQSVVEPQIICKA